MSKFLTTADGDFVNIDYIVRTVSRPSPHGDRRTFAILPDGNEVEVYISDAVVSHVNATILPAQPGHVYHCMGYSEADGKWWRSKYDIIAFHLDPTESLMITLPVTLEHGLVSDGEHDIGWVETPGGRYISFGLHEGFGPIDELDKHIEAAKKYHLNFQKVRAEQLAETSKLRGCTAEEQSKR